MKDTEPIHFAATLLTAGEQVLLRLPGAKSKKLPSRGQVAVQGTIEGCTFETVLEPDGEFGHWMRIDLELQRAAGVSPGVSLGECHQSSWRESGGEGAPPRHQGSPLPVLA